MARKLEKNVAIARSGVYVYNAKELSSLGLDVPPSEKRKENYGVYRPATVLAKAVNKFTKLPVTLGHPSVLVDGANFREFAQGFTGDRARIEYLSDGNEVTIRTSLTLIDNESVNAYYRGIVEVSPGYKATFDWSEGVSPNGEHYDIVMREIQDVNHLALTRQGRGGKYACILDSKGVSMKSRQSGLFYAIHKMLGGVKDDGTGSFTEKLSSLVKDRASLSELDRELRVSELKSVVEYLPDCNEKSKLLRFIDDMAFVDEETEEAALQSALVIGNLYMELDKAAMDEIKAPVVDSELIVDVTVEDGVPPKKEVPAEESAEGESPEVEKAEGKSSEGEKAEGPPIEGEKVDAKGASTQPEAAIKPEPTSIGPDDTIYDKALNELSPEEEAYIHQKLMELLKGSLLAAKPPVEGAGAPIVPDKPDAGVESQDVVPGEKGKPETGKAQEDEKALKDAAPEKANTKDSQPAPRVDFLGASTIQNAPKEVGFSIDAFFNDLKGGR